MYRMVRFRLNSATGNSLLAAIQHFGNANVISLPSLRGIGKALLIEPIVATPRDARVIWTFD